jgi:hypothetical protein
VWLHGFSKVVDRAIFYTVNTRLLGKKPKEQVMPKISSDFEKAISVVGIA